MKKLLIYVIICFFSLNSFSQRYNFTHFSLNEGLSQSQVFSITQAPNGDMWFGTHGGAISIYNGINVKYLNTNNGLPNYKIWDLFTASDGKIWIGTATNICYYDGYKVNIFSQQVDNVRRITEDKDKNIWFSTDTAIYKIEDSNFVKIDAEISGSTSIFCDSKNNLWFYSKSGISKITNGKILTPFDYQTISGEIIYEDDQQNIWFGTSQGLFLYNQIEFIHYTVDDGLASNRIKDIVKDNDGVFWIATEDNGLSLFDGSDFSHVSVQNGIGIEYVSALYKDFHGNIWIGTDGDGAYMFKNYRFVQQKFDDIAGNGFIMCVKLDEQDNFWIGTDGAGVITNVDGNYKTITEQDGLVSNFVFDIEQDSQGRIWFATYEGYSIYDGKKFLNYSATLGNFPVDFMMSLLADNEGNVWLGSNGSGLYKFLPHGGYINYSAANNFDATTVWDIFQATDNKIYFATDNGLIVFSETDTIHYTLDDGLNELGLGTVTQDDKTGLIWIGSDKGISSFDGKNFINYTRADGLSSDICYFVYIDANDYIISGNERGIDKIKFSDQGEIISIKHYGIEEGFFGIECNLNAIVEDDDGILHIGTVDWLTSYNPYIEEDTLHKTITQITNIKLFYEDIDWFEYSDSLMPWSKIPCNLVLPHRKNNLTFEFVGIDFQNPQKVKYQFMLEGFDEVWMPLTSAQYATYSNIPPGEYTFKVKAITANKVWNAQPVEFSFEIKKPFWQTAVFYVFIAIFIIGVLRIYIVSRTKRLKRAKIELQNKVNRRTAEILHQKEEIEAQKDKIEEQKEIAENQRDEISNQQKKITDSIVYAKRIQKALFPQYEIFKENFSDYFVFLKPRDIVSGDFFWIKKIENHIIFAVADCTGHGVPGAFMSLLGISFLNEIVVRSEITQTKQVLNVLRTRIKNVLHQSDEDSVSLDGMDIALCCIDTKDMTLEYSGANIPIYHISNNNNNKINVLKADRQPIGIYVKEIEFTLNTIKVSKGDKIYIFSDGIIDQLGGKNRQKYMRRNFNNLLLDINSKSMTEQNLIVEKIFNDWRGDINQLDDVLVLGLEI
ncbi:MAG: SpoIIE family protein phosphatase [Bacteroidales bacterium]|nr:SpoIIE family protein phosphatase [Bacteroidales bacterium]